MNKAITEGLQLTPAPFIDGLQDWSSQNGLPGDDTYANRSDAVIVPADQDFGGCLEIQKTEEPQQLRYMERTPLVPGCYLRITARVKAISGNLPRVQVAAFPVASNGSAVTGLPQTGPSRQLTTYGEVETITGIVGVGTRPGVEMSWDDRARFAHVGIDLTGPSGGTIRVDDLIVEDITSAFLRDMIDIVDVKDYGARGDGVTDDTDAFLAADNAARGRTILVSEGTYRLTDNVTIDSKIRFEGTVTLPANRRLSLVQNFDAPTYIDAFGNDQDGFERAIQALFDFTDHDTLDLKGRRIELTRPVLVQQVVGDRTSYANQRKISNGQLHVQDTPDFNTTVISEACTYNPANPKQLSNVNQVAEIEIGSLVSAPNGVGREVYVAAKNIGARTVALSQPLWGAPANQTYTFRRFRYALDFSGWQNLQRFSIQDIEFLLADRASGILLPRLGLIFHVRDCYFTGPKDRGLTSHAEGCQGMLIDRCQFLSSEGARPVPERNTIAFNVNKNDTKIRNNRGVRFKTWAVMGGTGHIITGNHFFQGDTVQLGARTAGIVFAEAQAKSVFVGNYIDNCYIEWTNEYDPAPNFANELSFGALQIVGNIIFSSDVASNYAPLHIKPFGSGHFINGMTVVGNTFKTIGGQALNRVDIVDTTHADLDHSRYVDVNFHSNTYHAVGNQTQNPITAPIIQNTADATWDIDLTPYLPFGGEARVVQSVMPEGRIRNAAGATVWDLPYANGQLAGDRQTARLTWPQPVRGKVFVTARCDAPT